MSKVCPACAGVEPNANDTAECCDDYKFAVAFVEVIPQLLLIYAYMLILLLLSQMCLSSS